MARISLGLHRELREAAKQKAQAEDVGLSQVIRWYLRDWVSRNVETVVPAQAQTDSSTL